MKLIFSCKEMMSKLLKSTNLIQVKSTISTFLSKCELLNRNLAHHEFYQFPSLSELNEKKSIPDDDLRVYCAHLEALERDMSERCQGILLLRIPDWVIIRS